ncbi:MAG: type II toxin-antitoxin system VapC family toxin [Prevotellaceae bacterium]|jgi:PIN domain nuclease of toxin-antitoxin system|nr:type II toxin-antitoxin system VapC family toxin [Prevotellaceae bacterium]
MTYLLDTHALIWATLETEKLSANIRNIIMDSDNDIYVSTVSFWEISLKTRINKFFFDNIDIKKFPEYARLMGFTIIDIAEKETITFHELPLKNNHKDPFDRMLIWQAITMKRILISKDALMGQYKEDGLKVIW